MAPPARHKYQCSVCNGTFEDPQRSGARYFHACPPLSVAELLALPPGQLDQLWPDHPVPADQEHLEAAIGVRTIERPGKRDENISPDFRGVSLQPGEDYDESTAPIVADKGHRVDKGPV